MPSTLDPPADAASESVGKATSHVPDAAGRFGDHGGRYVPETLMRALEQLSEGYAALAGDEAFQTEFRGLLKEYVGRPTPLYRADRLTEACGGATVWLKREDLNHTGAHKINNSLGQALLARRMGKRRIIAETGAGQHGVATATACARFGLECIVYMGEEDIRRQALNVFRMKLMGAEVRPVSSGSKTLKDATNEAMRDWMGSVENTHYIIGSVVGPDPFPKMVRDFQSVIGRETREQCLDHFDRLPDEVVACVGGGSNAAGIFFPFVDDDAVTLTGVEAGGRSQADGDHASTLSFGRPGVLHGSFSYVLQDDDGQTSPVHSVSAGLDYPGVGPEHSYWKDTGRVKYVAVGDDAALSAFRKCSELEGIIPAVETAHAIQYVLETAGGRSADDHIVICLSGRGDKDVYEVARLLGEEL
ncbi:tryptophan synthase subunit beta [Alienimonas chondri]|uniref:Tryptophan synthase beta chain n=1 Tax=Alienimonas chondri TaxID=2681879 RepID=A0ABX1VBZ6_9PLAN|nr:tryptophan synthase subunit beta [Alienimonas chondri]NNJ25629.1 Tryptophan synthase beta chain [Alienimonas chondri]